MIRELYKNMEKGTSDTERISPTLKAELAETLDQMKMQLDKTPYEQCRDGIFLAVAAAKEDGFVEGFKCAFRLFSECVIE